MKLRTTYVSEAKIKYALAVCVQCNSSCYKCPYYNHNNCRRDLALDALTLISSLEMKVMVYEAKENKS